MFSAKAEVRATALGMLATPFYERPTEYFSVLRAFLDEVAARPVAESRPAVA